MAKTDEFKIEKGIPYPLFSTRKGSGKWQVIIRQMNEGDSLLVATIQQANSLIRTARGMGQRMASRRENTQVRVWLLKQKGQK